MRALWTGSISFGLINIPVKLYSAADTRDGIDLHMLHAPDQGKIRYAKICETEDKEVPYEEIVKAYEYDDDKFVILTDKDFEAAEGEHTSTVDIAQFSEEDEVDIRYLEKPYYLEPTKGGEKAYALLREALKKADKIAVARFVLRDREHLAAIKPVGSALVLNQMRFPADLHTPGSLNLPPQHKATPSELEMAEKLIKQLTKPFIPEDFHDSYTEELEDRIKAKVKHQPVAKTKPASHKPTTDLMAALVASLETASK